MMPWELRGVGSVWKANVLGLLVGVGGLGGALVQTYPHNGVTFWPCSSVATEMQWFSLAKRVLAVT